MVRKKAKEESKKKENGERRITIRIPDPLFSEITAESKIIMTSVNEVVKRRLLISYGMMPQPKK